MKKIYIVVLFGLSLPGCDEYPGVAANGAAKMTTQPVWGDSIRGDIPIGGDCHIDSINGELGEGPSTYAARQEVPLKVVGWGAISAKEGILASDIAVALEGNGVRRFAPVARVKRQDVADYFKNAGSADTGFSVAIDLSSVLPGTYVLEVIQHKDGKDWKCHYLPKVVVVEK
jgi:hypothetical protein